MDERKNEYLSWMAIDQNFPDLMEIKLIQGRYFRKDHQPDEQAYVINEKAWQKFGWKDPIGKFMNVAGKGKVIGIVQDFHFKSLHQEIQPLALKIYPEVFKYLYIKASSNDLNHALADIEKTWSDLFPDRPFEYSFLDNNLINVYERELRESKISNFLGIVSIIIAAMGILGLSTLVASKRTKEIGIRKVNGAKIIEVLALLNKDLIKWVAFAFIIATPLAWYVLNKWLENFAYKTVLSWWIFALAGLTALIIALITISWQSWRAATRNPVEALRYE
jgi:putative ABC transport system permease protein